MLDRLFASLILLTRLPFWRLRRVPAEAFGRATDCWSFVGWLTGGCTALVIWVAGTVLSLPAAVIAGFGVRLLLTGALHEDGLADFCDGFGGGTTRERTMAIMKDSHIGTYGVLGLLFYSLLLLSFVSSLPSAAMAAAVVFAGDPLSKFAATQTVNLLPYVRPLEQSKTGTGYRPMSLGVWLFSALAGVLPLGVAVARGWLPTAWLLLVPIPFVAMFLLAGWMRRRIGGYTGDCCGAVFLICESAFYAACAVAWGAGL